MTYSHRTLCRTHRWAHRVALLAGGALVLCACLGDDLPMQADTGESTSTGPEPTVSGPPGTTVAVSSSGVDLDTTSTLTASTTLTSEGTAGSSGSSDSGETGTGEQGYGDCFNNPAKDVCLAGETCIDDAGMPPGVGVCALQDCGGEGECPSPPPGGRAFPACMDVTGDSVDECVLQCTGGADCPPGMLCFSEFVCVWAPGLGTGDFSCADENLGAALGDAVAMGTTAGQGDDFEAGCVGQTPADVQLVWTALVGGTYTFDTVGSSYDTVLYVLEDCVGPELACNDDTVMYNSEVAVELLAGQSVLIVVDGYNNSTGSYTLNIH